MENWEKMEAVVFALHVFGSSVQKWLGSSFFCELECVDYFLQANSLHSSWYFSFSEPEINLLVHFFLNVWAEVL